MRVAALGTAAASLLAVSACDRRTDDAVPLPPGTGGKSSQATGGTGGMDLGGMGASGGADTKVPTKTPKNLLVAFLGDQGNTIEGEQVLALVKKEGAAAVVHLGDFDYVNEPATWEARIDAVLGPSFPYFAVAGNHDVPLWSDYAKLIAARAARVPDMRCTGEPGVRANCNFRGLHIVQSCIGMPELGARCARDSEDQLTFLRESLAAHRSIWSVCAWHKNQRDMQVGTKTDEVGWAAYQACQKAGAFIATGHEHSYSRTRTLTKLGSREDAHGATGLYDLVTVGPGKTFVFVSGIGGASLRPFDHALHDADAWWASYYTSNGWKQNGVVEEGVASPGALFIRFHVDDNPKKAAAYFKDVNDRIVDTFTIFAE